MRAAKFRCRRSRRCFCRLKWVTMAVFPALSSENFYTTAIVALCRRGCSLWNASHHNLIVVSRVTHIAEPRQKPSKLNLATCSPRPKLLSAAQCYHIILILLSLLFLDITVTDTMAIILASFIHTVTQICRVFDSDVCYLSREAPERCSTLPFVLKMAKNEIVAESEDIKSVS